VAEAHTEDAAGPHPDQRLHGLEAGALRILPGVEEAEDARAPVGLEPDRDQAERNGDPDSGAERRRGCAGDQQDREQDDDERDRRPEIGLGEDQQAEQPEQEADGP